MFSVSRKPRLSARRTLVSLLRVGAVFLVVAFLFTRVFNGSSSTDNTRSSRGAAGDKKGTGLRCRSLPGAEDTVVVIKTGVTEFAHKLPIHLETTVKCYPHYVIFSDHHEIYQGENIIDALEPISPRYKEENPDFEFYRRVRERGREALDANELSNKPGFNRHPNDADKLAMGGWRLDKWKFLPMWDKVYQMYPTKRWYVFIEADTYMFWSNMLKYQAVLDHTKPIYAGAELFIDWTLFAHGGGGVLMSNAAMSKYVDEYEAHLEDWETFVDHHWAGDIVLGRALNAAGVTLTPAWPMMHPHAPGNDTYFWQGDDRRFWCYPVVSYHHVNPEVIEGLWRFEQEMIEQDFARGTADYSARNTGVEALKRREVFQLYIHSQMDRDRMEWDNNCVDEQGEYGHPDECQEVCQDIDVCMQWRYDHTTKKCWTNNEPRWGDAAPKTGYHSGWMHDRIRTWIDAQIPCGREGWVLP